MGLFFRPYRTVFEKSVIVCHLLPKGPVHQAPRMDRLMRYLPLPTGGKPFKWSTFLEKNLSSLSTGHEGPLWSKVLRKNSSQYPLEDFAGFERKNFKFFPPLPNGHDVSVWSKESEDFFFPLPTGHEEPVWTKKSETFSPIPTGGKVAVWIVKSEIFSSSSTPLTKSAEVVRFSEDFFFSLPTGHEHPFWPKNPENFSLQYPLDKNRRLV